MGLGTRLMNAVVNVLTAILNIRIKFKYVLLAFIIFVGGAIGITYKHMLDLVGGKDDFDEAKRYIEIKDVVDEQYIDEVSRQTLGDYAAAAKAILEGVGGASNVAAQSHCVSRLRIELKDGSLANEKKLRASGAAGIMRPNKNTVQIVIGAKTAEVAAAFEQLL